MVQLIRADPDALIKLADGCLTAADDLGAHYRTQFGELSPPAAAFGALAASRSAARVAAALQLDAQAAIGTHVQVLEGDADRLVQAAFAYAEADDLARDGLGGSRGAPA
ncbi:hypothetical protein [Dactylosporangium salmoneum]|uniref:PE domain-containing protein n=1 Tax=Dactylosporangium salmoneum TaxID=53361 RepID=A0ABN3HE85_9ACTN